VSDEGPGFSQQDRIRVFGLARPTVPTSTPSTPSNRAAGPVLSPSAATGGGSGVGLAIAKAFVEAHGGSIWADNPSGGGARVTFSLPVDGRKG
jgi:signal transduction histidine kinase